MSVSNTEQLKDIFSICDKENNGYISVEHFVKLAKGNFGVDSHGEQALQSVINVLDPEGHGQIDFKDFCTGVKQILELKSPSTPPVWPTFHNPGLSCMHVGSEETLVPADGDNISCGTPENSDLTFNEYDMMEDVQQTITSTSDDADSAISSRSPEYQPREQFEDFGECDDGEFDMDSSKPLRKFNTPLPRRISPGTISSHLYPNHSIRSISSNGGSRRSSCSDGIYDEIDGSFHELTDKVHKLEEELSDLNDKHEHSQQKQIKTKEQNAQLIERMHILEEQVREVELKAHETIEEEKRKRRDFMSKTDKEKSIEIELLTQRLQQMSKDYQYLQDEAPRLRVDNDRLRKENSELSERLGHTQQRLTSIEDEHTSQRDRLETEKSEMRQERQVNSQLLDEISRELEELRLYKSQTEDGTLLPGNDLSRSQRRQLEGHADALKESNARLKQELEDLQHQVLIADVREGRMLVQSGASIAQEIDNLPKDELHQAFELMRALKESKEINRKLHEYVDRMTLKIIEKSPSLLEI